MGRTTALDRHFRREHVMRPDALPPRDADFMHVEGTMGAQAEQGLAGERRMIAETITERRRIRIDIRDGRKKRKKPRTGAGTARGRPPPAVVLRKKCVPKK